MPSAAAFDAVNLYDLYRAMRALRTKLASLKGQPELQRSYLVGRPDSVIALAHLANRPGEAPVVRHLVLRELGAVVAQWSELLDASLVASVRKMQDVARRRTLLRLVSELGTQSRRADEMIAWFEEELDMLDRTVTA